ncbi:MAG: hypothetical protein R2794_00315 [Chitinophagales bacterium]
MTVLRIFKHASGLRAIFLAMCLCIAVRNGNILYAQNTCTHGPSDCCGFYFGAGIGGGLLALKTNGVSETSFSLSLPNLHAGWMFNSRWGAMLMQAGSIYTYAGSDRALEAFMLGGEYWFDRTWWAMAGVGMTLDASAFYTVDKLSDGEFYTGFPALTAGISYDMWKAENSNISLQYRIFYAGINEDKVLKRSGLANQLLLIFDWY